MDTANLKNIRAAVLFPAILVLLVLAAYAATLGYGFVCDDWPVIVNNPAIRSAHYLPDYFTKGVWASTELELKDTSFYRPMLLVYLLMGHSLWGLNPMPWHAASLALYAIVVVFVFYLLKEVIGQDRPLYAFVGAALYGLHPVHVESASWIIAMPDSLGTIFFLGAFLAHASYMKNEGVHRLVICALLYLLALLTKEVYVTFPIIALAYEYLKKRRVSPAGAAMLILTTALYFIVRGLVLKGTTGNLVLSSAGFLRLFDFISAYIKLLFIPWPIGYYFRAPTHGVADAAAYVVSGLLLAGVIYYYRRQGPAVRGPLMFFIFWLFLSLAPPLSLAFNDKPLFAVRYLFLPSVGFAMAVAWLMKRHGVLDGALRKYVIAGLIGLAALCMVIIHQGARAYRNDEAFYTKSISLTPDYVWAYQGLARHYERQGDHGRAISVYEDSLGHVPLKDRAVAYERMGLLLGLTGEIDRSIVAYEKALELSPRDSAVLTGLGNDYFLKNDLGRAARYLSDAYEADRSNYKALYNLAMTHEAMGDRARAVYYFELFLSKAPDSAYAELKGQIRAKLR